MHVEEQGRVMPGQVQEVSLTVIQQHKVTACSALNLRFFAVSYSSDDCTRAAASAVCVA
jgi:hypothetical protein